MIITKGLGSGMIVTSGWGWSPVTSTASRTYNQYQSAWNYTFVM